jgi:hypothetical protein
MKKIFALILTLCIVQITFAQEASTKKTTKANSSVSDFPKKMRRAQPADHFLIQFGSDSWMNKSDSARTDGGKHFNFYLMTDKPFKTNPKFSVAYGVGIGSSNIYFNKTYVDIKSNASRLPFTNVEATNHFAKFKVTEIFLELPVEVRYTFNPNNYGKSWKIALGAKVGTLLKAYTKGKDLQDKTGASIYGPTYIEKEYSKKFFNGTRLSVTGRIGYGNFSISGAYTLTPVLKAGFGPEMNTMSLGLTISGL